MEYFKLKKLVFVMAILLAILIASSSANDDEDKVDIFNEGSFENIWL
ncbi:hypothetical protein COLO4_32497 [Corchorus olitorius]|uniref:Uncharacterized protein n=1 Tax=Corchorus olitorius TaxID=93759 RepID=A0A1R3GZ76_9ROSI|nr:hypothetical protein COLO4_32497 [Corchorus olitorius]